MLKLLAFLPYLVNKRSRIRPGPNCIIPNHFATMDPLTGAITLAGAAITVAKRVHSLYSTLKNAPQDIMTLLDEVQTIRMILTDIQDKAKLLKPWIDISAVSALISRVSKQLEDSQRLLAEFVTHNDQDELIFKRLEWYRKKEEIKRLSEGFRSIQLNALAILGCTQL